ncbi:MAG: undecaprenyl/decaprenyl-phosphate alpha-N-acetylglucosaminyl 1-phosphate transferase [Phycisphaerae bacterium]|nr:undecaprenyl/decaprenyl-phosphate alpha-N-acetylglucosaminyl 1-phosphate transferase [Phycisphaerae bacterium]
MANQILLSTTMDNTVLISGVLALLIALFVTVILTPITIKSCWKLGILDRPDGGLKNHKKATATLGGIPLFISIIIAGSLMSITSKFGNWEHIQAQAGNSLSLSSFAIAALIILLVGIYDDIWMITPKTKLVFQLIVATVLINDGLVIEKVSAFGSTNIIMGIAAIPFTFFWIVGSCNAFNFIDGMDGLAGGIGMIMAVALGILGINNGMHTEAIIAFMLAGSLLGLLLYNYNPARIFLGDSGSMLIGLILSVLAIRIVSINSVFYLPAACLLMSIPVMDTLLSVLRRYSYADSPARGDRNHIHHCLQSHGLSVKQSVHTLWFAATFTAATSVTLYFTNSWIASFAALVLAGVEIYLGITLGCLNLRALSHRIAIILHLPSSTNKALAQKYISELERLWEQMKPLFEKTPLDRAILTLEDISDDGKLSCKTYQWVRSEEMIANLLANRWTREFSINEKEHKKAVLQLESNKQLSRDEQRIEWLLKQIRSSFKHTSGKKQEIKIETEEIFAGANCGSVQDFYE